MNHEYRAMSRIESNVDSEQARDPFVARNKAKFSCGQFFAALSWFYDRAIRVHLQVKRCLACGLARRL
jgi:hypothetical protein